MFVSLKPQTTPSRSISDLSPSRPWLIKSCPTKTHFRNETRQPKARSKPSHNSYDSELTIINKARRKPGITSSTPKNQTSSSKSNLPSNQHNHTTKSTTRLGSHARASPRLALKAPATKAAITTQTTQVLRLI